MTGEKKSTVRVTYEKKFENFKSYVESLPREISNRELAVACGLNLKTVYAYQSGIQINKYFAIYIDQYIDFILSISIF